MCMVADDEDTDMDTSWWYQDEAVSTDESRLAAIWETPKVEDLAEAEAEAERFTRQDELWEQLQGTPWWTATASGAPSTQISSSTVIGATDTSARGAERTVTTDATYHHSFRWSKAQESPGR